MLRLPRLALASVLLLPACGGGGGSPTAPSGGGSTTQPNVGPAGGTITAGGGTVRLDVPAGALSAPVTITLRQATGRTLDQHAVGNGAITIEPDGTALSTHGTLKVHYDAE